MKILRSTDRVDTSGIGRSKGYGFVEFYTPEAAMAALRGTNNNPDLFGPKKVQSVVTALKSLLRFLLVALFGDPLQRLIVEFALEDSRALRLRKQRKHRQVVNITISITLFSLGWFRCCYY